MSPCDKSADAAPSVTSGINPDNYYGCALDLEPDDRRHPTFQQQRRDRGFDDTDTWCLRSAILRFTLPRLKRFKEVQCGYPMEMTAEQWDADLAEMIFGIETFLADEYWESPEMEAIKARMNAGLKLFHDRFYDLWW